MFIVANTLADATKEVLDNLVNNYQYITSPRGQKIKEIIGTQIEIKNPYSNLFDNEIRSLPREYLAEELFLYFSGSNSAKEFSKASKFWDKIKNEDGTVNSAYGHLIFNKNLELYPLSQWDWAKQSLIKDKDSRQAIMHYNKPIHQQMSIKDFVCTLSNQFFIRDNKLHMISMMRSQDVYLGWPFDIVWFMTLIFIMRNDLLPYYPNLMIGKLIHQVGSIHLYERNFEMVEKMLQHPFIPASFDMPSVDDNPILNPNSKWLNNIRENLKINQ